VSFDAVITILGVVLIAFGLYNFLTGKGRREDAPSNKLEGFGVSIDVANPSVLLIILGVGLVLVPRFFPDAQSPDEPVVSLAPELPPAAMPEPVSQQVSQNPTPELERSASQTKESVNLEATADDVAPAVEVPPVAPKVILAGKETPRIGATTTAAVPLEKSVQLPSTPNSVPPVVVPKPQPVVRPAPEPEKPDQLVTAPVREPQAAPPKPEVELSPAVEPKAGLWVVVDADVAEYAGMTGMSKQDYSQALRERLAGIAFERFGKNHVTVEGVPPQVQGKKYKRVCEHSPAARVLLATVRVPPFDFSPIESGFWPDLVLAAVNCGDGRVHHSMSKRLTPQHDDKVFFEQDFLAEAQRFVAAQAYFLK